MIKYDLIDKCLFFPKKGILAIGDLHIGYEEALFGPHSLVFKKQVSEIVKNLKIIINEIKLKKNKIKKIIFLGDIKHSFGFKFNEKDELKEIIKFLIKYVPEKNIIFIKGNHDTMDYTKKKIMKSFHIEGEILFIHGHKNVQKIDDKRVKIIVLSHLHPSIVLSENPGVKVEKYKCFLIGKIKKKVFFILPSFLNLVKGTSVNNYNEEYANSFSIISKKDILKSKINIIGEKSAYEFGRVEDL